MRIGIVSDIHDNLWNLQPAIRFLIQHSDELICCGDLCSPFVMDELRKYHGTVHIVFGNNDADTFRITRKADDRLRLYGEFADLNLGGRRVAINHFDYLALPIAAAEQYDLVCYGHNHRIRLTRHGRTTAINPGPIMGAAFTPSGWEEVAPSFAVYDTDDDNASAFRLIDRSTVNTWSFPDEKIR